MSKVFCPRSSSRASKIRIPCDVQFVRTLWRLRSNEQRVVCNAAVDGHGIALLRPESELAVVHVSGDPNHVGGGRTRTTDTRHGLSGVTEVQVCGPRVAP